MRPTSLRQQLTRAAMFTTLFAIVLSAGALITYELSVYRSAGVADLRAQADLIARSTAAAVQSRDARVARDNLSLLQRQPRIQSAAVYGLDGTLIASYTPAGGPLLARVPLNAETWGPRYSGSTLEMTQAIERNGQRLGMLYLKAEHDVWHRLAVFALIVLAVGAISLTAAFYLFVHLQRRITAPLEKMTDVARDVIDSHNWSLRAPATDYQDVGLLVDAFNRMLSECETRTTELEREMVTRQGVEQELRHADRQKDEFLATLAHELRNPLSPMTSAVALLQMPEASAQTRDKALVVLERQLRHIVRLVNDLLDASRVTTGKLSLDNAPVEMGDLLKTIVDGAQGLAMQQGLKLSLKLPSSALHVHGDAIRLTQVFSNLLSNACRYTLRDGRVDVALTEQGSWVEVSIADTGIGVEPEMQERIFDLFEQADKTLQRGNAGLGVGLTLARQIIQLHHGVLTMSSEGLNQGSCFTVRLPLLERAASPLPSVAATPPGERAAPLRPLHILIADDNVDLTESFAEILTSSGHTVDVVHDGAAAVERARENVPDIALLDIGMPKLDGYEVARQLRAGMTTQGIHLIAITGWGQASDREAADAAGFDHHLLKPVEPQDLVRLISESYDEFQASRPGDLR